MRKRAFYRSSKLMLPGVVVGAIFKAGFSADLSSWRLVIDEDGNLLQDTEVWQLSAGKDVLQECRQEEVKIGPEIVLQLLLKAQEISFSALENQYEASMDDQPDYLISIKFGEIDKTVHIYGAGQLARQGNIEVQGFLELWNEIHIHAPFPPK